MSGPQPIEKLAPLIGNTIAWKMLGTWSLVAGIRSRGARRRAWAQFAGLDELAIEAGEPVVAQFTHEDGTLDEAAARFVRAMVAREVPTKRGRVPDPQEGVA